MMGLDVLARAIGLGRRARSAAVLSVVVSVAMLSSDAIPSIALATQILPAIVLAIVGSGAVSIDARRFSRRVVHLKL